MIIAKRVQMTSIVVILLVALLLPLSVNAAPKSYRIELPTRTLTPSDDGGSWLSQRNVDTAGGVLLQFRDHPDAAAKRTIGQAGIQLQEYIGGGTWVAYMPANANSAVFNGMNLRWAGPMIEADKIDPRIVDGHMPSWADTPDGNLYAVAMMKNIPESEAEVLIREAGGVPGDLIEALHTWYVLSDDGLPARLAKDPRVHYITSISPPMQELNAGVRSAMNVDELQAAPYNLSGAGETVCVYDGGIVFQHADFGNRLTEGEGGATAAHATHVAGTVGGAGGDLYRGMAPEVNLISYQYEACIPYCLYDSPQDIYENYEGAYIAGARLFTNSIGANIYSNGYDCEWQGDYEITSALVDSLTRGPFGEPVIITWAAGNERGGGPCGTTYETMSVPAAAKNTIVVGATTDNDGMTSFSSWGPTDDGRIKPDVCAPGNNVSSCNSGGGYTTMSGTSMATPAVAGVNALLLQAWHQSVNSNTNPFPETVKALLCNSADDLGQPGPDYQYGWGRVNAQHAVDAIYSFGFHEGEIDDDDLQTITFEVPVGLSELRVTLSWSDPPAGYLPEFTLVNDLDLGLRDPTQFDYIPFVMDPANPSAPATNGVNTIDNVEQIVISNPVPGEWVLGIQGTDIPIGSQTFGIAANVPLVDGITAISGTVTDAATGDPIGGARIRMETPTGELNVGADDEGGFLFYTLMEGDARMTFTATGYRPQSAWAIDDGDGAVVLFVEMYAAESAMVQGSVYSEFGVPIPGAVVYIVEIPTITATTDVDGLFEMPDVPTGELLTVYCDYVGLVDSRQIFLEPGDIAIAELVVTQGGTGSIGPDGGGYVAVQSGDDNPMAPVYDWVAIDPLEDGDGVRVPMPAEETPVVISLPFEFPYYDSSYTDITVNENGFFSLGDRSDLDPADAADYRNSPMPSSDGPPAVIAPFWEDMRAAETNLSYYDDPIEGRFIVEWYDTRQWPEDGTRETFQVILYDPEIYPEHGDWGHILFQYADVNDLSEAGVGIEDETETSGLTITNDGTYHPNASTITDESAILFYRPTAGIEGVMVLDPPDPEVIVTMTVGNMSVELIGEFSITSMVPSFAVMNFDAEGYEHLTIAEELLDGDIVDLGTITLTRLDTPIDVYYEELNGNFENGASVFWTSPTFGEIDEFLGLFRVYRDGQMMGETDQLDYQDENAWVEGTMYWVTALYAGGESDSSEHAEYLLGVDGGLSMLPTEFEVAPPWPNPFNPSTAIKIGLPEKANLSVAVFDVLGREVTRLTTGEPRQAGYHRLVWDATGHASGVYFVRVNAGPHSAVKKVMLLK
jgi:Subtilase family/Carboxypeptidase regulatory-like domain/Secretion system C-terminal sorting domain